MAYLTQDQVKEILAKAPANLDKTKLIQELAKTNTLQGYNEPQEKKDGIIKSIIKDPVKELIVRPGDRIARAASNLAAPLLSKIPGAASTDEIRRRTMEDTSTTSLPVLGDVTVKPQMMGMAGVKQVMGDVAKSASYLYSPAGVAGAVKPTVAKSVFQGAKTGAVLGGAYGAGDALQQNQSAEQVIKSTATGAATGAAFGGAISGVIAGTQKGFNNLNSRASQQTIAKYDELFTGTKAGKTLLDKSKAQGKTPSKFLVEHNFIVDIEKGKVNATPTIEKIQSHAQQYDDILDEILKAKDETIGTPTVSLRKLADTVKQKLSSNSQNKASGRLNEYLKEVDNIVDDLVTQYGDDINFQALNQIKQAQWKQSSVFDATRPNFSKDIHYNFGTVAKKTIEDLVDQADVKGLNNYIGDHYNAIKNLQRLDAKPVRGGRLGGYFGRVVGAIAGAKAGPIGSIIGAQIGDNVSTIMQNNHLSNPVKKIFLAKIAEKSQPGSAIYAEAQAALAKLKTDSLYKASRGVTTTQKIVPADLKRPKKSNLVKVNTYRPDNSKTFSKYLPKQD